LIVKNSELTIYESSLGYPSQKIYRNKNKIIFEYRGGSLYSKRIYDVSRVSNVPVTGVSAHDFTVFVLSSPSDEYIAISTNYSKAKRYKYAERVISVFSSDGRKRIARIYIYIVKDSDEKFFEYNRKYEYMNDSSLKSEIEKYAEGKYDLHITYINNKIDKIKRKRR